MPMRENRFMARLLALTLTALLTACAAPRAVPPQPIPPGPVRLTASDSVAPGFDIPTVRDRMVFLARQEWSLFGSPVVQDLPDGSSRLDFAQGASPAHELQPPMLSRVLVYWYGVSTAPIVGYQGELRPWSAAFISWLAQGAGLTPDEFPRTVLHWDYIERSLQGRAGHRYVARDPLTHVPAVGDLVCNARDDGREPAFTQQIGGFADLRRGPYHCDLVVGAAPGGLEAIGGNVGDAVSMTRLPIDAAGRLQSNGKRRFVAVLEHQQR